MNQAVQINKALADLLDYKVLKSSTDKIMVSSEVINDNSPTPQAILHNVLPNKAKAFLLASTTVINESLPKNTKSFVITPSFKENTKYVLGWIRNMICDKDYINYHPLQECFFATFYIYTYSDFLFLHKLLENMLSPREGLGLNEILLNVIEHDVFKDHKTAKHMNFRSGNWLTNMENHITITPIQLSIKIESTKSIFTIRHYGKGFDIDSQIIDSDTLTGRGIDLCTNLYFETLDFFDHACQIAATAYHT